MAEIVLATGAPVELEVGVAPAVIVGADPFGDDSDATYVTLTDVAGFGDPRVSASLEQVTDPADVLDIIVWARVQRPDTDVNIVVQIRDEAGVWQGLGVEWRGGTDVGTLETTLSVANDWGPTDLAFYANQLRAFGQTLDVVVSAVDTESSATVFGATVTVVTADPEPTGKPFRRVWPREHGRIWPPPRHQHGRRTVGGYL